MSNEKMSADDVLSGLQEFVPYVQAHSAARKGYVVGMRRKNKRDELDEVQTYLYSASVRAAVAALIAERDALRNALYNIKARCEIELGMDYYRNADQS